MADDLIARIRARLDGDERIARAAERYWHGVRIESATESEEDHVRRWDPARVLTEVESKRRILDLHTPRADGYPCPTCWDGAEDGGPVDFPCPTVRALADE